MTARPKTVEPFSVTLRNWLATSKDLTLAGLIKVFNEKSFALIFLLMLALPALPIPTGGVTHVTEIIAALLSLQLIIGRKSVWLPKRFLKKDVGKFLGGKAAQKLIGVIEWFERWSRRRGSSVLANRVGLSGIGVLVLVFTVAAFVAPPFSGLDTLPALGVVVISLSLILEDIVMTLLGIVLACVGIGLEIAAGTALYSGLTHFF